MIKFIGRGSAFNTKEGNNSMLYVDKNTNNYYLFDCGYTTFERINEENICDIWDKANKIVIFLSHRHPDHIGGVMDMLFIAHFIKKIPVSVVSPDEKIPELFTLLGVTDDLYEFISPDELDTDNVSDTMKYQDERVELYFKRTTHTATMPAYEMFFRLINEYAICYYSGDSNSVTIDNIVTTSDNLFGKMPDKMYIEVSYFEYKGSPHNYYGTFDKCVDEYCAKNNILKSDLQDRIRFMHIDDDRLISVLSEMNYKIVEK